MFEDQKLQECCNCKVYSKHLNIKIKRKSTMLVSTGRLIREYKPLHTELTTNSYPVNLMLMGICDPTTTTTQASTYMKDSERKIYIYNLQNKD